MSGLLTLALVCAAVSLGSSSPFGGEPRSAVVIVFDAAPGSQSFGTVAVTGLPQRELSNLEKTGLEPSSWLEVFSIRTRTSTLEKNDHPAVLGSYLIERGAIRFRPRFPFRAGMSYRGEFDGRAFDRLTGNNKPTTRSAVLDFTMPEPDHGPSTSVEAVYPTATELPENLLRFYVYFSAPMRAKGVEEYVHLYDGNGREVELPFVEIRNGLWDPMGRRLTLFFHPGRIKRGVAPNLEMGPALRQGETFRLAIDAGAKDAMGYPLINGFEKEIRVVAADRESPNQADWKVSAPDSANGPLTLHFPEPLDYALLQRMITVEKVGGGRVPGTVEISENETRWQFLAEAPWSPGAYIIRVEPTLEDVAGNTFRYRFDEEIVGGKPGAQETAGPPIELEFRVP